MNKNKKEHKDLEYKVFSMRLSEKVKDLIVKKQRSSGKSWNLFIKELLEDK